MRPNKRIFCRECSRKKILFDTEKKALNFIKWNGDEIEATTGRRPVRVYYCTCCGGWHTTSIPIFNNPNGRINKVLKAYNQELKFKKNER